MCLLQPDKGNHWKYTYYSLPVGVRGPTLKVGNRD